MSVISEPAPSMVGHQKLEEVGAGEFRGGIEASQTTRQFGEQEVTGGLVGREPRIGPSHGKPEPWGRHSLRPAEVRVDLWLW